MGNAKCSRRAMAKNPFLTLLVLSLMLCAGVSIAQSGRETEALGRSPEVVSFTASPVQGQPGAAVLSWRVHATSVVIEATPVGESRAATELNADLAPTGTLIVHPAVPTKYVIRCIGPFSGYAGL